MVFAFTDDQLELLQRSCDGLPMWGGSMATERLRREIELLFVLGLIQPAPDCPYRLTQTGFMVLDARRRNLAAYAAPIDDRHRSHLQGNIS